MADVYDAVKPVFHISRVLGLAPFSFDSEQRRLYVTKWWIAYSFIMFVGIAAVSSSYMYDIIFNDNSGNKGMYISEANKICQAGCNAGLAVVIVLLCIIQRQKLASVVQNIHLVNGEMAKLGLNIPYHQLAKISLIQLIVLFATILGLCAHDLFVWAVHENVRGVDGWISCIAAICFNYIMESQFISGALLLKKHFTVLNNYLLTFNDKEKQENAMIKEMTDPDSFLGPKLIDPTFIAWDGSFSHFRTRKVANGSMTGDSQLSKIKVFRKVHSNLCDVKESLNTAFSLQLLTCVAKAFIIITSDLYMLFTTLNDPSPAGIGFFTYPIVWTLTHAIELICIVVTCTKTSKQANQTAVVVHKLLAKDCDPDIRNQLKLFSIQLLHRKISFSACGFFTLDMTLLQAIIGAATTYLVILIQFHNTYERSPK